MFPFHDENMNDILMPHSSLITIKLMVQALDHVKEQLHETKEALTEEKWKLYSSEGLARLDCGCSKPCHITSANPRNLKRFHLTKCDMGKQSQHFHR